MPTSPSRSHLEPEPTVKEPSCCQPSGNMKQLSIALLFLLLLLPARSYAEAEVSEGERLARIHCATCHSFPEPSILPKRSWRYLLPYMGFRMGVEDLSTLKGESPGVLKLIQSRKKLVQQVGVAPDKPMVNGSPSGTIFCQLPPRLPCHKRTSRNSRWDSISFSPARTDTNTRLPSPR